MKVNQMSKCPKCHEEIEYLRNVQTGSGSYYLFIEPKEGYMDYAYEWDEFVADNDWNIYECPECGETLFDDEEEAVAWLEGKEKQS
jgi:predicted RNA-binding Zn-ribbon protein involved in translation (DUF1610 family)